MIQSTASLSLVILGALLLQVAAQDAPEPVAQPAQLRSQFAQPATQLELEANAIPSRKETKEIRSSVAATRRTGQVSRTPRVVEVRPFNFNNGPFVTETPTRPLMIRSSRAEAKQMDQLSDDLTVMARILDKAIAEHTGGPHPIKKAGGIDITVLNAGLSSSAQAMYVDDYGAIFTLSVNMPLRAQPQVVKVEPKEPKRQGSAWEEAQSELGYREKRMIKRWQPALWRQFDQEEVDAFKAMLVETLREATNIRHLKPTDIIAVVVRGMPQSEEQDVRLKLEKDEAENSPVEETANPESTLVLRIQKMDLDRSVAGGRDSGELRKTVRISIY
jgi:hypothetical protein